MAKQLFSSEQQKAIQEAIAQAELNTCGEIRVHVDLYCKEDPKKQAIAIFQKLGMDKTKERNGVLIYLATKDHKLAIIGDVAINEVVPDHFWDDEIALMASYFKKGEFTQGLVEGIHKVGEQMKVSFPYCDDDENELSNEISFGDDEE